MILEYLIHRGLLKLPVRAFSSVVEIILLTVHDLFSSVIVNGLDRIAYLGRSICRRVCICDRLVADTAGETGLERPFESRDRRLTALCSYEMSRAAVDPST